MEVSTQTEENAQDVNVENPKREKPREPTDSELSLCKENTTGEHRGNDLVLTIFVTTETHFVSLSLSLVRSVQQLHSITLYKIMTTHNNYCLP